MKVNLPVNKDEINTQLLQLCSEGTELFLVGGYIRDILLEKECFDRDYAVKGESAIGFAQKVAEKIDGYFVLLDSEHDIARVVMPDKKNTLDFAGCVGQNIFIDLKNRDFSINAMAIKLNEKETELIDPLNGLEDLQNKTIRIIDEKNLIDDPLRVLRAFRFVAQLGFLIEDETVKLAEKHKSLIINVSVERVTQELIKLMEADYSGNSLIMMKDNGLLEVIIPELSPQAKIPPNLHHHLWLLDHSIESVKQLENELKIFPDWAKERVYCEFSSGIKPIALLKLATLLHDLGKPSTWNIDEEGRHRFIKHEEVGAEMIVDLLKRLKFSKNAIKYIAKLIKYHMYPSQLLHEGIENLTDKAVMRMFRRIGEEMPDLILLGMADRLSTRGPEITEADIEKNIEGLYFLLEKYKKAQEEVKEIPKLVDGNEVMEILNIPKCPKVGKVLKELHEAQISGDVNTRDEALEFVSNFNFA